ncbi:MAG: PPC domain-containing protein [Tepidisphaeraceae bacterium]|jgi:hypothetical protein
MFSPRILLLILAIALPAVAQDRSPRIGYVYPAGGRQGTEFDVAVGGQQLAAVTGASVSGAGVRAFVVERVKPLTQAQAGVLREKLRELQEKRQAAARGGRNPSTRPVWTTADEKLAAEINRKLSVGQRRNVIPALAETVIVHVMVAADAEPGKRDLRLATPGGWSNPFVFCVGQLPEFHETESSGPGSMTSITLPAVANGQIMPGEQDRFGFKARKGQRLVVAVSARDLIPYIADAVPGWFQAIVTLYDAKGDVLGYADDFRFNPDPVLYYRIPTDGEYVLEIKDALYRGREDFVYRITMGEVPFITSIFPLGCAAGAQTTVDVRGWNFPRSSLVPNTKSPGIQLLSVRNEDLVSNLVPFAVDTLPECMEQEPNNTRETAQRVTLPVIINGRIDFSGDWDVFRFDGRAGEKIVAEVLARRLNSPLDSVLRLTDAAGKQLAFNDDHEDKGAGLITHHADSLIEYTLPVDGTYYLHLGDAQRKGGAEYGYRLRISAPRPDFALRVVPSSISLRAGEIVPVTVYALRRDGFAGDIALELKDAPPGFALGGAWVPGNAEQVRLTLTAPSGTLKQPVNFGFEGRATIDGREVVRRAMPAEDMMQAFAYRHLVLAKEMKIVVSGRGGTATVAKILSPVPVKIPAGGTVRVQVEVRSGQAGGEIECILSDPPEGTTIQSVSPAGAVTEIVFQCDAAKAKPGLKGNLIVEAVVAVTSDAGTDGGKPTKRRTTLGLLPAIPFEIVAPTVAP